MSYAIHASKLCKTYGATRAVDGLDLTVERGKVYAFLGPNGAGKSTTIRMLLALQRPTSGSATVCGFDVQKEPEEVHRRIGYLPGDLELYSRMTGQQHIDWFASARAGVDRTFVADLTTRFDVVMNRPLRELSKGNRQKIGLILAVMHRPELLILDEPTSGLDPLMQNEFERLVRETVDDGRTVFLSSHELDEVQRLADHVAIIKQGKIIVSDTVANLAGSMPQRMDIRFPIRVEPSVFGALDGVRVLDSADSKMTLDVTGPIAPVLRVIADRDPVDLVVRPASLDELFLGLYRGTSEGQPNAN